MLKQLIISESGQGLAEYSLILSMIALALIVALKAFGTQLTGWYEGIITKWPK